MSLNVKREHHQKMSAKRSLALDGGWGWVIVFASTMIGVIGNILQYTTLFNYQHSI